jgi:hypothetical protein
MMSFIMEFPIWLQGCKALESVTVEILPCWARFNHPKREEMMDSIMGRVSRKLGVEGVLVTRVQEEWYCMTRLRFGHGKWPRGEN